MVVTRVTSSPSNLTRPPQGVMMPAIARNVVVLPAPLAPTIEVNWPRLALSDTPHSTWTSP